MLICISNKKDSSFFKSLTLNKEYVVLSSSFIHMNYYYIKDDAGFHSFYPKELFSLKSKLRDDKINNILGNE